MRAALRRALGESVGVVVAGEASSGAQAVDLAVLHRPDVVLMDIVMPGLDGYAATREIMRTAPTPIVLMSSIVDPHAIDIGMEVLRSGALAVVEGLPPRTSRSYTARREALARLLRSMAKVKLAASPATTAKPPDLPSPSARPELVAVGIVASTGGPAAVVEILKALTPRVGPAILVVQHLTLGFAASFAKWLSEVTGHDVIVAEHGRAVEQGRVYVAPDDHHLGVSPALELMVTRDPLIGQFRPSGTFLLRSLASALGPRAAGIILTGMGDDAAAGALELRKAGGLVLAQDQATSVVFGMPAAALARGGVDALLPLTEIAPRLFSPNVLRCMS
jgi:two-component system chemotaxis response regulator CheB